MSIVLDRLYEASERTFIRQGERELSYSDAVTRLKGWLLRFPSMKIHPGEVVSLVGRFTADSTVLLLALLEYGCIVVPLDGESQGSVDKFNRVAKANHCLRFSSDDGLLHDSLDIIDSHELLDQLRTKKEAGVILFTSGSTGESKAAVHAFPRLIARHVSNKARKPHNILLFLKFDHIGGLNTMLSVLMNGGCMTAVDDRSPSAVCRLIQNAKVEVLPTTPSFLNMLILSRAWQEFDLSSLKTITYGTEPMPESTLQRLHALFPGVKLKQTYGLTELGIFPTLSHEDQSTFMAIREGDIRVKVIDDVLYIKSDTAMLGYLNAESPFDDGSWYNTGDRVVQENGFIKILCRDSEIINVGGEKVYPSEVESILLEMDNVRDVSVYGKQSPIVGQIVYAVFQLEEEEDLSSLRKRVAEHCRDRLVPYKIPRQIEVCESELITDRLKKVRYKTKAGMSANHG